MRSAISPKSPELNWSRYEHADGLVGVYREQEENSSKTLTLDLRKARIFSFGEAESN